MATRVLITGGAKRKPNGQFAKQRIVYWTPECWDDGWIDNKGKFHVYLPSHPKSSPTGWVFRSWAVWWLNTGQIISHPQALHHKNHNGLDDRIENLQLMLAGDHTGYHSKKEPLPCICEVCGKTFYLPQWRINGGRGRWCTILCARQSPENRKRQSEFIKELHRNRPGFVWRNRKLVQKF